LLLRSGIYNGSDIDGGIRRIAQGKLFQRAAQHCHYGISGRSMQTQQAKRGASLTCRPECAHDYGVYNLLRERARVYDHRIDAARLSNQRYGGALRALRTMGERLRNCLGDGSARSARIWSK